MESILKKLQTLSESDFYPYHMPGHKRYGATAFATDITEIDDFDNLHHATGIIKEAQERTARLYGAKESFFLVNGSTCGLLTAIFASFRRGDKVLVARNCHKAVYHGLEIRGLEPVYVYPNQDDKYDINVGIEAAQVLETLKKNDVGSKDIKGMILTSPTYEGLTSDIKGIAELLHSRNMVLIVDEAHGAHFGFHPDFPDSAVVQGADLVIQSMHKTLPSMTQTALLHRCSHRVDPASIQKYLGVFQTSSPSYVFMAYMDECICMLEEQGKEVFEAFAKRLKIFYKRCGEFKYIKVRIPKNRAYCPGTYNGEQNEERYIEPVLCDPGKIVIAAEGLEGKEIYAKLRQDYHLQLEMYAGNYALAIMTICDSDEGFERLYRALQEMDCELDALYCVGDADAFQDTENTRLTDTKKTLASLMEQIPDAVYIPAEAELHSGEAVLLKEAAGKISKEYIYLYPPGIPFIVPGERISDTAVQMLLDLQECGYELQGTASVNTEYITVVS